MDLPLRTAVFNALYEFFYIRHSGSETDEIYRRIWSSLWRQTLDRFPSYRHEFFGELKSWLFSCEWFEPYDLIELCAEAIDEIDTANAGQWEAWPASEAAVAETKLDEYAGVINDALVSGGSGYRLVGVLVAPISNEVELEEIETALQLYGRFAGASQHIEKAINLLGLRPTPDCENAVKEAISAVEAAAKAATNQEDATLGNALRALQQRDDLHPALANGWSSLYGFTSDEGGIRHSMKPGSLGVDAALAKYMVVSCSAFVNYLIQVDTDSN